MCWCSVNPFSVLMLSLSFQKIQPWCPVLVCGDSALWVPCGRHDLPQPGDHTLGVSRNTHRRLVAVQLVQNHGVVTQFMIDLAPFTQNLLFNQCHTFCMKSSGHHSQAPTTWNQHPVSVHHPTSVSLLNSSLKILLFSKPFLHLHFPVCVRACVHACMHACVCACLHLCVSVRVHMHQCLYSWVFNT